MRVPAFEFDGWACTWEPRRGHVWERGRNTILLRSNAAWRPGMAPISVNQGLLPQQATVERTWSRRNIHHELTGWGVNTDGGVQDGSGVYPDISQAPRDLNWLDGVIERHAILGFHFDTGALLTREDIGYEHEYTPLRNDGYSRVPFKLWPFSYNSTPTATMNWQRYDPAHGIRAHAPGTSCHDDPVGFLWAQACGNDVMLALPRKAVANNEGDSLYRRLENSRAWARGSAESGEVRANAWSLGAVTQAYRLQPDAEKAAWIREFVEMIYNLLAANGAFTRGRKSDGAFQGHCWIDTGDGWPPLSEDCECDAWWEGCFLVRTLYDAAMALSERETLARVKAIVQRRVQLVRSLPEVPGQYGGNGPGKFLVVAREGALLPQITEASKPGNNSYNGYFWDVAGRLGVL